MVKKSLLNVILFLALVPMTLSAQDVKAVLTAAEKAMGSAI